MFTNCPFKFRVFTANVIKRSGHMRVAVNISTIEIAKTEKTLCLLNGAWSLPF
jgi:hypothetical protein